MNSEISCSVVSLPSAQQMSTSGRGLPPWSTASDTSRMRSFQVPSSSSKRLESSGNCDRISSLCMKMGSSRHQFVWNLVQIASITSTLRSFSLHSSTSGLQNSMKRPCELMLFISIESASSFSRTSDRSLSSGVRSSRERSNDTLVSDHVFLIAASFFSILYSRCDWSTISPTSSAQWCSSRSSRSLKQKSGPLTNFFFVTAMSWFQCRSCMVSLCRLFTRGSAVCMFLTSSVSQWYRAQERQPLGAVLA
mmetsp:Transcript_75814/g.214827  ORF Transcript_75814/g.214827 Transcript_75814/m.214827 type:complete len:250 (+) Transcript_75814:1107-1856(+)